MNEHLLTSPAQWAILYLPKGYVYAERQGWFCSERHQIILGLDEMDTAGLLPVME